MEGVDGASLRTIAADAQTSIGMVYYYFPTKDELFLAVIEEVYAKVLAEIEQILQAETTLDERLRNISARVGAASGEEVDVFRLLVREALISSTRLDRVIERFQRGHLPLLFNTMMEGMTSGRIDPTVPLPLAIACAGAMILMPQVMHHALIRRFPHQIALTSDELAALSVDRLFRGIGAPQAAPVRPEAPPPAQLPAKPTRRRNR